LLPFFSGQSVPAILALADGSIFHGFSIGASGHTIGEVVFNTAMTGYQEILTDPSYSRQIVTLTYPHIGNVGVNEEDVEAGKIHAAGLIIKDLPLLTSNFRSQQSLSDYLKAENVVGIAGIDTRKLTRILREKGAQNGAILAGEADVEKAQALAKSFPLSGAVGTAGTGGLSELMAISDAATAKTALSTGALSTISGIDNAVKNVSNVRGTLGAIQNRLESRLNNLATYQENLTASESRVRDVDMAEEMTKFTKLGILQQAGTSMLAQANQAPQGVLSLLR
jgi:carbamoylphosphate synthase small subunit